MKPRDNDYTVLFGESYLKTVLSDPAGFFGRFYELFQRADPRVTGFFSKTDIARQLSMLEESLLHMVDFSRSRVPSKRIEDLADYHGENRMNIPARLFEVWLECLLDTLRERDREFDKDTETAWRVILAPGLAYMKSRCSGRPDRNGDEVTGGPQDKGETAS